jgi:hypothetical protein
MARKPPKGKSLAEVNPQLAKEWHPTKNGDLTALDGSLVFQIKFCAPKSPTSCSYKTLYGMRNHII